VPRLLLGTLDAVNQTSWVCGAGVLAGSGAWIIGGSSVFFFSLLDRERDDGNFRLLTCVLRILFLFTR
jgi:hypothetical protein